MSPTINTSYHNYGRELSPGSVAILKSINGQQVGGSTFRNQYMNPQLMESKQLVSIMCHVACKEINKLCVISLPQWTSAVFGWNKTFIAFYIEYG